MSTTTHHDELTATARAYITDRRRGYIFTDRRVSYGRRSVTRADGSGRRAAYVTTRRTTTTTTTTTTEDQ